jgi:hypothetical protein
LAFTRVVDVALGLRTALEGHTVQGPEKVRRRLPGINRCRTVAGIDVAADMMLAAMKDSYTILGAVELQFLHPPRDQGLPDG